MKNQFFYFCRMMKLVAILMSSMILLTSLRDLVTNVYFHLNQNFIAQNQCINRDRPEANCHGKCFLKNSLSENHENEENKAPITQKEERPIYIIPSFKSAFNSNISILHDQRSIAFLTPIYAFEYHDDVFHPPTNLA
ncbi:MAG: hypothetical protein R2788_10565 [Saprospiraceae bacterium]